MNYFKKPDGSVWAIDAGQDPLITSDMVRMTDAEAQAHINPPVVVPQKQITPLDFLDLFTEAEQLAIVQAVAASPSMKLWYDRALAAQYITIADPRTEGGLSAMVAGGLLTDARKAEIVGAMS